MAGRTPRGDRVSSRVPPAGSGGVAGQRARFNEQVQAQLEQQAAELRTQAETYLARRYACGCVVGGPALCAYATGRYPARGVVAVHGTPIPEPQGWPDQDEPELVDWGSSEPVGQPAEQQYVRGYQVVARAFRDHRAAAVAATLVGVWVVIVTIADNPTVTVIVSALLGLVAGYLTTWPRVQSRRARRAARDAELAARADRQHQLYMRDPEAYLRRIEKGETP